MHLTDSMALASFSKPTPNREDIQRRIAITTLLPKRGDRPRVTVPALGFGNVAK